MVLAACARRSASICAASSAPRTGSSRVRRGPLPCASNCLANVTAPAMTSPFTSSSIRPSSLPRARRHRPARQHHVGGVRERNQARHALRAAGARDDAERQFRQAQARAVGGDAVVAGERDLGAGAERGAVDRGDDRNGQVLDQAEHVVIAGRADPGVEFLDVGAGNEGRARRSRARWPSRRLVARSSLNARWRPRRTSWSMALTGGRSTMTTAMPLSTVVLTGCLLTRFSDMPLLFTSRRARRHFRTRHIVDIWKSRSSVFIARYESAPSRSISRASCRSTSFRARRNVACPFGRELERMRAAVAGRLQAAREPPRLKAIEDPHQPGALDAKRLRQRRLRQPGIGVDDHAAPNTAPG